VGVKTIWLNEEEWPWFELAERLKEAVDNAYRRYPPGPDMARFLLAAEQPSMRWIQARTFYSLVEEELYGT
jgi:hypothetical protein